MTDTGLVSFSVSLYRILLLAYPGAFRRDYGEEMALVFRDCCLRAARRSGRAALLALWAHTFLDYVISVVGEHANQGANMTRTKWIKLSGWALVFAPLSLLLGWLAGLRPEWNPVYSPYNAAAWPVDRYLNVADDIFFLLGFISLTIGAAGLLARFGSQAGVLGRGGLVLSVAAGLFTLASFGIGPLIEAEFWWYTFMLGWTVQMLGFVLFGIACLREKVLSRWNAASLLGGLPVVLFILVGLVGEALNQGAWIEVPDSVMLGVFLVMLFGLVLLGYRLQADTPGPATAPGAAAGTAARPA